MADTLVAGPSANMLDPRVGNDKRKALLQLLMQRAQGGSAVLGARSSSGGPVTPGGTSFLGGMRAIPRNRSGLTNTNFTQGSQVAAQFLGGMGVGARQDPQSSPGQVMAQFLGGSGGGSGVGSPDPQAAPAGAPVAGPDPVAGPAPAGAPAPVLNAAGYAPNTSYADLGTVGDPITGVGQGVPGYTPGITGVGQGAWSPFSPPSSGTAPSQPNLIPLGGGAFYNPETQIVHYSGGGGRVAN